LVGYSVIKEFLYPKHKTGVRMNNLVVLLCFSKQAIISVLASQRTSSPVAQNQAPGSGEKKGDHLYILTYIYISL
jgi:hypothetical protein